MCKLRFLDIRHAHLQLDLEYHLITGGLLLGQQSLQVGIFFLEKLTARAARVELSVALCQVSLVHVVTDLFLVTLPLRKFLQYLLTKYSFYTHKNTKLKSL